MMQIMNFADDILKKIETSINQSELADSFTKKGEILEIKDGVAIVTGLENAMYSEIVLFENGTK